MTYKFVFAIGLLAVAQAAVLPVAPVVHAAAPVAVAAAPAALEVEEIDPHPQYQYGYDVQDSLSGDSKGHVEERDGDFVRGEYTLVDADGLRRTVTYTADPINGFNAVVRREPLVVAAPVVKAAPVVAAPAPVAAVRTSAPLAVAAAAPAPIVRAAAPFAYAAAPAVAYRNF